MAFEPRTTVLPDGRTLVVRPVGPADVDGLVALYAGLTQQDSYYRFFSGFTPPRSFFERMASIGERGGCGLVATITDGSSPTELIGEAGYSLLADGDGELSIVVAKPFRGWLGPHLLDALLSAAADRGVPNLQADVLVSNVQMLSLIRARGCATVDRPDGTVVRLAMSTSGRVPAWPGPGDRPRVLVEAPGGWWQPAEAARAAGLQVMVCAGPRAKGRSCPALVGEPCPLASAADVIVLSHPRDDERWAALPAAHQEVHRGVPVCLQLIDSAAGPPHNELVPRDDEAAVAFVAHLARGEAAEP